MADTEYDIRSLIGNADWKSLQDAISRVTDTAVTVTDSKGIPIVNSSGDRNVFESLKELGSTPKRCVRCILRAGLLTNGEHPTIVRCRCGLAAAVVPIVAERQQRGSIVITQVRLPAEDAGVMCAGTDRCPVTAEDAAALMAALPERTEQSLTEIASMVASYIGYLLRCVRDVSGGADGRRGTTADRLKSEKHDIQIAVPKSSKIYPAAYYVELNRTEMVGMSEMAALCDLSPSYFSKLFLREMGENFTCWVSRRKTEWAKEMLLLDGVSIGEISDELGFADTSYFIKVFKRYAGMTPMVYRTKCFSGDEGK